MLFTLRKRRWGNALVLQVYLSRLSLYESKHLAAPKQCMQAVQNSQQQDRTFALSNRVPMASAIGRVPRMAASAVTRFGHNQETRRIPLVGILDDLTPRDTSYAFVLYSNFFRSGAHINEQDEPQEVTGSAYGRFLSESRAPTRGARQRKERG